MYSLANTKTGREFVDLFILHVFHIADGPLEDLALDWVTGNLYVATYGGNILACNAERTRAFSCFTILTGQNNTAGISLDPVQGYAHLLALVYMSVH